MPGPYFKNQLSPSPCGCFYPDVTRIRDNKTRKTRTLFCINHGEIDIFLEFGLESLQNVPIPSEEWREKERARLRKLGGIRSLLRNAVLNEVKENLVSKGD